MLTRERLTELLRYDPETGKFYSVKTGKTVGGRIPIGYLTVFIDGKRLYLHRLAVLYMTGEHPDGQVDHINGDRLDNRWGNLRVCAANRQQWNMKKRKDGSSRFKGVVWSKFHQRWRVFIAVDKRKICGSVHADEEAAARQYDDLARKYFGQYACVNFPREGEQSAHDRNLSAQAGNT